LFYAKSFPDYGLCQTPEPRIFLRGFFIIKNNGVRQLFFVLSGIAAINLCGVYPELAEGLLTASFCNCIQHIPKVLIIKTNNNYFFNGIII
jgi:hypothetical protein